MTGCVRLRVEGLMLEKLTARALNEGARFSRLTRVGRRVLLVETDAAGAAVLEALCQRFSISCTRQLSVFTTFAGSVTMQRSSPGTRAK